MDAQGQKSLALFPAKFQKSMWIKRGSFVVVDESGKQKALESGSKISCLVSQVLFHRQVRELKKLPDWPEIFKSSTAAESCENLQRRRSEQENKLNSSDGEGDELFPLEANTNRIKPFEEEAELESESSLDSNTI